MTLSPCRNCPNQHLDKNLCMQTCELLSRVQSYQAGCMVPPLFSAVDIADDGRYRLATAFDFHSPSLDACAC